MDNKIFLDSCKKLQFVFNLRKNFVPKFGKLFHIRKRDGSFVSFFLAATYDKLNIYLWNNVLIPFTDFYADRTCFDFRPYRDMGDTFLVVKNFFCRKKNIFWFLEFKICKFFNLENFNWILNNCPIDNLVLRSWCNFLKSSLCKTETFTFNSYSGIIISNLINFMFVGLL